MSAWRRLVGDRPIVTRLVLAVAATMTVVLVGAAVFVFWRVQFALDRQVDQDLLAYQTTVQRAVRTGDDPPAHTPGLSYQVFGVRGRIIGGDAQRRLVSRATVLAASGGEVQRGDVGSLLPPDHHPYRVVSERVVPTAQGPVVVASAISRGHHDEALRELLLQLSIAAAATLAAASLVGYRTARAALNPVESYRLAAEDAGAKGEKRLPVTGRDDELTRLGRTFNALLDRLEASSTRERQFLADASHELRAPLALMKAELEWVLVRPRDAAETRTTLESLRDQVDRMVDLSNVLLDLEELRSVKPRRGDRVGLVALASDSAARFQRQAAGQGRQIRQVGAGPAVVAGDRRWLELAIDNLVSNALRYGTGEVRVATAAGPTTVTISVEDDGAGFPPEFVDVAFDRFTRADDARSTRGTGLGLAVVSAVADFHQGTATIAGSRVTLTLPRAK